MNVPACVPRLIPLGHEFRLSLKTAETLDGVKNALLALGYRSPSKNKREQ
jgi:hypothetical protein